MLYTEDFSMHYYVGFSQIGSHILITFFQPELVIFVHVCTSCSRVSKYIQCSCDMADYIYMTIKIIILIFHTFFSLNSMTSHITFAKNILTLSQCLCEVTNLLQ